MDKFPYVLQARNFFPSTALALACSRDLVCHQGRHAHDFMEIGLISHGQGSHLVYRPQGDVPQVTHLQEGDVFFVPLGWSHSFGPHQQMQVFNLCFAPEIVTGNLHWKSEPHVITPVLDHRQTSDNVLSLPLLHLPARDRQLLETCLQTILRELTFQAPGHLCLAHAKLLESLVILERCLTGNKPRELGQQTAPGSEHEVERAIAYMGHHLCESIDLAALARAAHLSPHYFCEVFKLSTGISPMKYLTLMRLEQARHLLLTSSLSTREVAFSTGFQDSSYFARAFKRHVGKSPRDFAATGISS